ncbi:MULTISPECIES: hypothetical protein [unclassified Streptomyces]|uniref:hypothetical protein n=1 Tax=unclassified Streptomyces TaxID=2593676 RepID=UPI0035D856BD
MCAYHIMPGASDEERSARTLVRLLEKAGDGAHRLIVAVEGIGGNTVRSLEFIQSGEIIEASEGEGVEFLELLSVAMTGMHHAILVMATKEDDSETMRAWRFRAGIPSALNAKQAHFLFANDPLTGEPREMRLNVKIDDAPHIIR